MHSLAAWFDHLRFLKNLNCDYDVAWRQVHDKKGDETNQKP